MEPAWTTCTFTRDTAHGNAKLRVEAVVILGKSLAALALQERAGLPRRGEGGVGHALHGDALALRRRSAGRGAGRAWAVMPCRGRHV
jgi:hypothetical protein